MTISNHWSAYLGMRPAQMLRVREQQQELVKDTHKHTAHVMNRDTAVLQPLDVASVEVVPPTLLPPLPLQRSAVYVIHDGIICVI